MFGFNSYSKPTNVKITIHNSSNHPANHKMSANRVIINRAIKLPFKMDKNYIKQVTKSNEYHDLIIDKLLTQIKIKLNNQTWIHNHIQLLHCNNNKQKK